MKMLETLKFIECILLPLCQKRIGNIKFKFLLVVDSKYLSGDAASAYEKMQNVLGKKANANSGLIRDNIKKYKEKSLHNEIGLYFEDIQVMDVQDYMSSHYY